eukprot:scaffold28695_cov62-Phaeocystis_antarctica.AAC.3
MACRPLTCCCGPGVGACCSRAAASAAKMRAVAGKSSSRNCRTSSASSERDTSSTTELMCRPETHGAACSITRAPSAKQQVSGRAFYEKHFRLDGIFVPVSVRVPLALVRAHRVCAKFRLQSHARARAKHNVCRARPTRQHPVRHPRMVRHALQRLEQHGRRRRGAVRDSLLNLSSTFRLPV